MTPLVKINDAGKKYIKDRIYNLEINPNEFILLTGKNGAGKSTLIKLITGYIKPDFGKVFLNKNLKISYLPELNALPLIMNVKEYLQSIHDIKSQSINWDLIKELQIPLNKTINQLSKGNKQMVGIVATLAQASQLIILDEPLSGVDKQKIKIIKDEIKRLKNRGISFLICSHLDKNFKSLATREINIC